MRSGLTGIVLNFCGLFRFGLVAEFRRFFGWFHNLSSSRMPEASRRIALAKAAVSLGAVLRQSGSSSQPCLTAVSIFRSQPVLKPDNQSFSTLKNGFLTLKRHFPILVIDFPILGNGFPTLGNGFPTLGNGFPILVRGFPTLGNDFPILFSRFPTLGNDFPILVRRLPTLGKGFPILDDRLPTLGNDFPILEDGFPNLGNDGLNLGNDRLLPV